MAADRWGGKPTQESKTLTPAQFEAAWQKSAAKLLQGEAMSTDSGAYFVRCGRSLGNARVCLQRLEHSAPCAPIFATICDMPLPNAKRCVLNAGHKGKCLPFFPRGNG